MNVTGYEADPVSMFNNILTGFFQYGMAGFCLAGDLLKKPVQFVTMDPDDHRPGSMIMRGSRFSRGPDRAV